MPKTDTKSADIIALADEIIEHVDSNEPVKTELSTSQRIIARVTDGIYREPWAAFRELIANAYDADATRVIVETGAPDYGQVIVRDDGIGMAPETVAYILKSIGGSSKRTKAGEGLKTVSVGDNEKSPSGRPLIGKIGIGLFAVAQLTQHFQIITKSADSNIRTSATVKLRTHDEEKRSGGDEKEYVAGDVEITSETVAKEEKGTHGTSIILYDLKPEVKRGLQSRQRWVSTITKGDDGNAVKDAPEYHLGILKGAIPGFDEGLAPNLPWVENASPLDKFKSLFEASGEVSARAGVKTNLDHFDEYLQLVWQLSLALPLEYIDYHPFDIPGSSGLCFYHLPEKGNKAEEVELKAKETPRTKFDLISVTRPGTLPFEVLLDEIELRRPIELPFELARKSRVPRPMLMIGKVENAFKDSELARAGGQLCFEAYLYWNSRIVPKETSGVVLRVREASGTLFDRSFLDYQVSEQNRLSQITAEIFVNEGLDSAVNIDRESFNYSHPHFLFIQKWLHRALRILISRNKAIAKKDLDAFKVQERARIQETRIKTAIDVWDNRRGEDSDSPILRDSFDETPVEDVGGVEIGWGEAEPVADSNKASAIAIVLEAYGVLGQLNQSQRSALIKDILKVLEE